MRTKGEKEGGSKEVREGGKKNRLKYELQDGRREEKISR